MWEPWGGRGDETTIEGQTFELYFTPNPQIKVINWLTTVAMKCTESGSLPSTIKLLVQRGRTFSKLFSKRCGLDLNRCLPLVKKAAGSECPLKKFNSSRKPCSSSFCFIWQPPLNCCCWPPTAFSKFKEQTPSGQTYFLFIVRFPGDTTLHTDCKSSNSLIPFGIGFEPYSFPLGLMCSINQ